MKCPKCESTSYRKNGHRSGKQNYLCKNCGKQFLEHSSSESLQSAHHSSNGHTQTSAAEATEFPLVKPLPEEKETVKNLKSTLCTAQELLQSLLSEGWLESSAFKQFIQKVQQAAQPQAKSNRRISILLLDAENLKLDINVETFLASLCKYPLQVKIAFANWKNPTMGKQDSELYERGYQLQHVPGGKDSADGKMIALGSSILRSYPTVKEVFVCSCDHILTHLCNQLQTQGLTVYWVSRQARCLKIENCNTSEVSYYSLAMQTEIPSFEVFVQKLEEMINAERESITERLSKLTSIANLFQERCNLTLKANRSNISPGRVEAQDKIIPSTTDTANSIKSKEELEKTLIEIIKTINFNSPKAKLSVAKLGTELRKVCGQTPNSIIKNLKLGSSFTKFLHSSPAFKLKKTGKEYEVALSKT